MRKKKGDKFCTLHVTKSEVTFRVINHNGKDIEVVTPNTKEPRVIAPVPTIENLINNAKYFSSHSFGDGTIKGYFDKYIHARHKELYEQINEIRKSIKRIEKTTQCIQLVQDHMKTINSSEK